MRRPRAVAPWALALLAAQLVCTATSPPRAAVSGELKQWHKVTLTLDGPFARERDTRPNPFLDYRLSVRFAHGSGAPDGSDGRLARRGAPGPLKFSA